MHLRVVGVAGKTVKNTAADHQCHHGVAICPDADLLLEGGLEVDSEEGEGSQLQLRFRHEIWALVWVLIGLLCLLY